jgi:serine protease
MDRRHEDERITNFIKNTAIALMLIVSFQCHQALANVESPNDSCILLGPTPSFIIKFKEQPTRNVLHSMSTPSIAFTHAKRMSEDYVIVYFKQKKYPARLLQESQLGCYTQSSLLRLTQQIQQSTMIEEITPNFLSSTMEVTQLNAPRQWNLFAPPGGVDAQNTWLNFTIGQPSVTIAVLDTGIMNHDALNTNILPGVHFTDNGSSGFGATPSCIECAGYNHGTFVAGIIAATGASAYGETVFGVAPNSTILPINVFTKFTDTKTCGIPPCLLSYLSDQINALHWLAGNDFPHLDSPSSTIVGINMSLGNVTACPDAAQNALNQVQKKGLSVIVAAGNQNNDAARNYPANCSGVIAVAATGPFGERASYSNWGSAVTISAPGGNGHNRSIYSTIDDAYANKQGTSLAAPHVSGIIALLYSIDPTLDPEKVRKIITAPEAVTPFPSMENLPEGTPSCIDAHFPEKSCGTGIINAYKSAQKLQNSL